MSGYFVDLFAGLGGLFYLIGTYFFYLSAVNASVYMTAVYLFSCGGLNFLTSGLFMQYRYFLKKQAEFNDVHV
jgi:hypothetical protein